MLSRSKQITYEEFLIAEKNTDISLEFIDGKIYLLASLSVEHQRIVTRLSAKLSQYFEGTQCEHFVAPFDVILSNETETNKVQPDITVICDKDNLNENNYTGIPKIVIEVLSPSTAYKDYIFKMDLYMKFGIKEYWIVSPKNREIQAFTLENGMYGEPVNYSENKIIKSTVFSDMEINLENIFI